MIFTNIQLGSPTAPGSAFTVNRYIDAGTFKLVINGSGTSIFEMTNGVNRRFAFSGTGQYTMDAYGIGTFTGTATKWLAVTATGLVIEEAPPTASITANNGLTMSTATNVQLGGTLIQNTTINTAGFTTTWTGAYTSGAPAMVNVTNTSSGTAFTATAAGLNAAMSGSNSSTGDGILALNIGSGNALNATSITGLAGRFRANPSSTNTVVAVGRFIRGSSGTPAAGMGNALELYLESTSSDDRVSNQFISKWVIATDATRTSQLIITGVLSGTTGDLLKLNADKSIQMTPITAAAASAITPAEGMIVFVSDTDATFTTIGFWGYENGAWVDL